jgi:hypothetical protein
VNSRKKGSTNGHFGKSLQTTKLKKKKERKKFTGTEVYMCAL